MPRYVCQKAKEGIRQMKRFSVFLTAAQIEALKLRAAETGCSQSEQIRRALNLTFFADAQGRKIERRNGEQQ